jgi:hypothetical protein
MTRRVFDESVALHPSATYAVPSDVNAIEKMLLKVATLASRPSRHAPVDNATVATRPAGVTVRSLPLSTT